MIWINEVHKLFEIKAVSCSLNVGPESQCGRVVDEISCYCANFNNVIRH
jgi:hypothetical protein